MSKARIAIIAGTGMSELFNAQEFDMLDTPYGKSLLGHIQIDSKEVLLLLRHGPGYVLPPHKVNYRANIFSLKESGVEYVFATNAAGSMRKRMKPGDLVLADQIVDFTKSRSQTFFEGGAGNVVYTDVTTPYSEYLRQLVLNAAKRIRMDIHKRGTYVCTEGPRFETAAEIKLFAKLGCDVVGMTGSPEAFLARELGLQYATIVIVTNWAAGIVPKVSHEEVLEIMRKRGRDAKALMEEAIKGIESV